MSFLLKSIRLMSALKSLQKAPSQMHGRRFLCMLHNVQQNAKGAVSQLFNSTNGAEIYLVGTRHGRESSAQLVKKVISVVEPNVIAVELCKEAALIIKSSSLEIESLYQIFLDALKIEGGLLWKCYTFLTCFRYRQLKARGIFPGKEFKVAMEESERRRAQLVFIDDDSYVHNRKLCGAMQNDFDVGFSVFLKESFRGVSNKLGVIGNVDDRIAVTASLDNFKLEFPEVARVTITNRDHLMFRRIRTLTGKVVVVVGIGHMDGIEELWSEAEQNYLCAIACKEYRRRIGPQQC